MSTRIFTAAKIDLFPLITISLAENLLLNTQRLPVFFILSGPCQKGPHRHQKSRGRARCSVPRIYLCTRARLVPRVHRFGHRAFWKPFQRLQPIGRVHCARAGDASHEASRCKSSSRVCGSSACFGAAHWSSQLSGLGSAYLRPLAR